MFCFCCHGDLPGLIPTMTASFLIQQQLLECLTVFDEVLDDVFAAGLDGVMQQRAAVCVLQGQLRPLLVELRQLQEETDTFREKSPSYI